METLATLGFALGLASLAGLNLYLTVFVTGLSIQQHWIDVSQTHPELAILAHPAILVVSGVMYLLQFFADKVPWVDSLWDAVHTFIKPVGGAFLAIRVLGTPDPVYDVIIALLAGSATMLVHGFKSGTRLVVNHSPEPFSNIALSVGEDVVVLGGLALIWRDPVLALIVFSILLMLICYFAPKLLRAIKVHLWLIWKKLGFPARTETGPPLTNTLPADLHLRFHRAHPQAESILWAAHCISSSSGGLPGNRFGYLVATPDDRDTIWFIAKGRWGRSVFPLELATFKVAHEPKFLTENLVIYSLAKKAKYQFLFNRTQSTIVAALVDTLSERLGDPLPPPQTKDVFVPGSTIEAT